MTDQPDSRLRPTRRQTLGGTAGLIAAALGIDPSTAQEAIDVTGGSLMALTEATNVAGKLFIGPDSAKSTVTPETGRVYKAVDSGAEYYGDGSSWTKQPVDAPSVRTEDLRGTHDRLVDSTADLESLPSNIEAGETVAVAQPDTPYRPASWPGGGKLGEIDVSNIEIRFQSPYAKNGEAIIKPADGSNIGGLALGRNSAIEDLDLIRYGWDGNESTMDDAVDGLCGLWIGDVSHAEIRDYYITRTHPYHEHGKRNSGIVFGGAYETADYSQVNVDILGGVCEEIGDRSLELFRADDCTVRHNRWVNGFDRAVTFAQGITDCDISHNLIRDNVEGSGIKGGNATRCTISHNRILGQFRGGIEIVNGGGYNTISNNIIQHTTTDPGAGAVSQGIRPGPNDEVSDNLIYDTGSGGLEFIQCVQAVFDGISLGGNTIRSTVSDGAILQSDVEFSDNTVVTGKRGVRCSAPGVTVADCFIKASGSWPIEVNNNDATVEGCTLDPDGNSHGVRSGGGATGLTLRDNEYTNVGGDAVQIVDSSATDITIVGQLLKTVAPGNRFLYVDASEFSLTDNENRTGVTDYVTPTNQPTVANDNRPRFQYDSPPTNVGNYVEYLASSSWDPNSTGGDSVVMTTDGGSSWSTVVAL